MSAPAALDRLIFQTSRLTEFCSEKELTTQTGHASDDWPLVILKELVDNALDACEEAGAAPVIHVEVSDAEIAVFDNGPGIAPETVVGILDYNTRTSSREAYCSPTRGAQGNALKTLLGMPFALDGERGETTIESQGVAHRITISIDPIRQEPRLVRVCEDGSVKSGTRGGLLANFVREFRGLSATVKAKAICETVSASRLSLTQFNGDDEGARVGALLDAMRKQSRPVKPRDLGIIGEAHLRAKFESAGAVAESFSYKRSEIEHDGVPYLAEAAFGYCPKGSNERRIITGVNWSPAIGGDLFRRLGDLGQSLGTILTKQRTGPSEPIITILHLACPRVEYLDRGKSSVRLPS
jgi:DNA topoisomerase VI subunit B